MRAHSNAQIGAMPPHATAKPAAGEASGPSAPVRFHHGVAGFKGLKRAADFVVAALALTMLTLGGMSYGHQLSWQYRFEPPAPEPREYGQLREERFSLSVCEGQLLFSSQKHYVRTMSGDYSSFPESREVKLLGIFRYVRAVAIGCSMVKSTYLTTDDDYTVNLWFLFAALGAGPVLVLVLVHAGVRRYA